MTARLLPDLDDELTGALTRIEELLLDAAEWEEEDPETGWPAPLARGAALEAVRRLWGALDPVQNGGAADAGLTGRLFAPGGTYEHTPLRVVDADAYRNVHAAARPFARASDVRRDRLGPP